MCSTTLLCPFRSMQGIQGNRDISILNCNDKFFLVVGLHRCPPVYALALLWTFRFDKLFSTTYCLSDSRRKCEHFGKLIRTGRAFQRKTLHSSKYLASLSLSASACEYYSQLCHGRAYSWWCVPWSTEIKYWAPGILKLQRSSYISNTTTTCPLSLYLKNHFSI